MIFWPLFSFAVLLLVAGLFWGWASGRRSYMWNGWAIALCFAASIAVLILGIWKIAYVVDSSMCRSWAEKTGRVAKFAVYNVASWDCLTKTHDGLWISKDNIGDFNK